MDVAYAVITCPRPLGKDYLTETLASLSAAGFPSPVIFDDSERQGSYRNWKQATRWLLECSTSEALLVFQDDIKAARGLREWLHWPGENIGAVSLYTPKPHIANTNGWNRLNLDTESAMWKAGGALALMLTRDGAEEFLAGNYRPECRNQIDYAIGKWCQESGRGFWRHTPSLVEHTGSVSCMGRPPYRLPRLDNGARMAEDFCEDVDDLCDSSELEAAV